MTYLVPLICRGYSSATGHPGETAARISATLRSQLRMTETEGRWLGGLSVTKRRMLLIRRRVISILLFTFGETHEFKLATYRLDIL